MATHMMSFLKTFIEPLKMKMCHICLLMIDTSTVSHIYFSQLSTKSSKIVNISSKGTTSEIK